MTSHCWKSSQNPALSFLLFRLMALVMQMNQCSPSFKRFSEQRHLLPLFRSLKRAKLDRSEFWILVRQLLRQNWLHEVPASLCQEAKPSQLSAWTGDRIYVSSFAIKTPLEQGCLEPHHWHQLTSMIWLRLRKELRCVWDESWSLACL